MLPASLTTAPPSAGASRDGELPCGCLSPWSDPGAAKPPDPSLQTHPRGVRGTGWEEGRAAHAHLVAGWFPWLQLLQAEPKEGEDDAGEEDHKGEEGDRAGGT